MLVREIDNLLRGTRSANLTDDPVTGVTQDSRLVRKGSVFVAVRGEKLDGHLFIKNAISSGATAVISEKMVPEMDNHSSFIVNDSARALSELSSAFYGHPSRSLVCVGVTGTDGKTSTATMIRDILNGNGGAGLTSTVSYSYSQRSIPADRTTPDAVMLQSFLKDMVDADLKFAVVEVSSHGLIQHRVADVDFKLGVFTNLTPEHLDYHETIEKYRDAKAILFQNLPRHGWAVLNNEDPASDYFEKATKASVLRYGPGGDLEAVSVDCGLGRTSMVLRGMEMDVKISPGLTGYHNVQNVLAAACAARALDIAPELIAEALNAVSPVRGRLEKAECGMQCTVLIDYAHTARALRCILNELKPLCPARLIVVFGCGGDRDRSKRPLMGRTAEEIADMVWVTSDNPRSENPGEIIAEILSGMENPADVNVEPDRELAIRQALSAAGEQDVVLIAGKGHEQFQIVGGTATPFDDREVAQRIGKEIHGAIVNSGN